LTDQKPLYEAAFDRLLHFRHLALQAGGRWFEPSTAHDDEFLLTVLFEAPREMPGFLPRKKKEVGVHDACREPGPPFSDVACVSGFDLGERERASGRAPVVRSLRRRVRVATARDDGCDG
jgi:hypothetical protein